MMRRSFCLECRMPVAGGRPFCAASSRHRVIDIATPNGREKLLRIVWGSRAKRARLVSEKAPQPLGWLDLLVLAAGGLAVAPIAAGVPHAWIAMLGPACWFAVRIARASRHLGPTGSDRPIPRNPLPESLMLRGVVSGDENLVAPLSGQPCVAYALWLFGKREGPLEGESKTICSLYYGETCGFRFAGDDGVTRSIPAGPILFGRWGTEPAEFAVEQVETFLDLLDPLRRHARDLDPFPHDEMIEVVLRRGERAIDWTSPEFPFRYFCLWYAGYERDLEGWLSSMG